MQPVFQVGAAHRRCALWSQRQTTSSPVLKGIHLLVYNVCVLTHATSKKSGVLKSWGINTFVTIELADINHFLLYIAPVGLLLG